MLIWFKETICKHDFEEISKKGVLKIKTEESWEVLCKVTLARKHCKKCDKYGDWIIKGLDKT
jgi:hypothetical protein